MYLDASFLTDRRAAATGGSTSYDGTNNSSAVDWISAISGFASAIVGIITLLTVYIGAMQFLSQNRMYRHGLSWRSIGPWQKTVASSELFGLQRRISAPAVSLRSLVEQKWEPNISFPIGILKNKTDIIGKAEGSEMVQAKATWVNFMQTLDLSPDNSNLYEVQNASELLNGIVPMHWAGNDLVSISSILGFQSSEEKPSFKSSMPLPMQWSGPLGWLQFRASANGCVAEFRSRMKPHNQIPIDLYVYYDRRVLTLSSDSSVLRSRLWVSINGLTLPNDKVLYLGGADRHKRPQDIDEDGEMNAEDLLDNLMSNDLSDEEIMRKIFGKKEGRSEALNQEVERTRSKMTQQAVSSRERDTTESLLEDYLREKKEMLNKKQVLRRCPGLLSTTVEGELANSRGLSVAECIECDRKYTEPEDIDSRQYPYNLGNLYMDNDLLKLMKSAVLHLQPDGFYFCPAAYTALDLREVFKDIDDQSNVRKMVFPQRCIEVLGPQKTPKEPKPVITAVKRRMTSLTSSLQVQVQVPSSTEHDSRDTLLMAMKLCNYLQKTRKTARAYFSVSDMRLMAKAVSSLRREFPRPKEGRQPSSLCSLLWAIIYSRKVSRDILKALQTVNVADFMTGQAICSDGKLDIAVLLGKSVEDEDEDEDENEEHLPAGRYSIPHLDDGIFTGEHILAALASVFITYYWIDKSWITDVAHYDATIPQSVLMC